MQFDVKPLLPNKQNTCWDVRKLLFKRLLVFFLFRTVQCGVYCARVLWRPGDVYHRRNWLSVEAATAEAATDLCWHWGHNCAAEREAWPDLPARTVWHAVKWVSVTCVALPSESWLILLFIFRCRLRRNTRGEICVITDKQGTGRAWGSGLVQIEMFA